MHAPGWLAGWLTTSSLSFVFFFVTTFLTRIRDRTHYCTTYLPETVLGILSSS